MGIIRPRSLDAGMETLRKSFRSLEGGQMGRQSRGTVPSGSEASALPTRKSLHLTRKIFHFGMGYGIAWIFNRVSVDLFRKVIWIVAVLEFVVEVMRLSVPQVNRIVGVITRPVMRAHETSRFSGTPYYLFGVAVATTIYPPKVATIAIICLATLDPVAASAAYFTYGAIPFPSP